jgi:hypothetical protein
LVSDFNSDQDNNAVTVEAEAIVMIEMMRMVERITAIMQTQIRTTYLE